MANVFRRFITTSVPRGRHIGETSKPFPTGIAGNEGGTLLLQRLAAVVGFSGLSFYIIYDYVREKDPEEKKRFDRQQSVPKK